jgi:hypothetical protein
LFVPQAIIYTNDEAPGLGPSANPKRKPRHENQLQSRNVSYWNALGMRLSAEVLCWQGLVAEGLANLAGLISNSCVSDHQNLLVRFSEDTRETMLLQCRSLRL